MTAARGLVLAALVDTGLLAGLYAGFSCAVLPGLRRTSDGVFVETTTAVNRAVRNPGFAALFFGAPALTLAAAAAASPGASPGTRTALAVAVAAHVVGAAVTATRNLPLNAALAATAGDPARARRGYEAPWRRWNAVRAAATTAAALALGLAVPGT
ncbi:anthrone oxygenase family protein [Kineococcus sp. SYSU DK004]|uniref:anthrone oxygenase family protein n=1 Tax=Kineococcus sp. SYSU DK004 TaxID=3383125 RepID=UPI003D7DE361